MQPRRFAQLLSYHSYRNLLATNLNQLLTHCQHLLASSEIEGE